MQKLHRLGSSGKTTTDSARREMPDDRQLFAPRASATPVAPERKWPGSGARSQRQRRRRLPWLALLPLAAGCIDRPVAEQSPTRRIRISAANESASRPQNSNSDVSRRQEAKLANTR